jgi:hypothetical protein
MHSFASKLHLPATNLSFWSKIMPRYFASVLGLMVVPAILTGALVRAVRFLVKWMSTYLDFSNWAPCCCLHVQRSLSSFFVFAIAVLPCTPYRMSSMNPSPNCSLSGISRRSLLYNM